MKQSAEWAQRRVGSRKGYHHSPSSIEKMRAAKLGVKNPFYGKHWKESSKAKFRLSMVGFKHSEETKEKLRSIKLEFFKTHPEAKERFKGKNNPMYGKIGILNPNFGKHISERQRAILREVSIGRYIGTKNPFYGKHHPPETRKRMKERWKHRAFPEKDNKLELKLQKALLEKGVTFQKHASVTGRPDIFLSPNICIFVDGCYWHGCPCKFDQNWTNPHAVYIKSRIRHDMMVNEELAKDGFVVLRFKEHEINQDIEGCISAILEKLNRVGIK
jgi:DNA mismatch endonuclease (patch repair protein)